MTLEQLEQYRNEIDKIDSEILKLVNKRAEFAQQIGFIKKSSIIYRPEREAQILARIQQENPGPLDSARIIQLFTEIMSICRALEKPMTVACLGPQGTFSEEAAIKRFGSAFTTLPCDSIDTVFRTVESGNSGYGVVPVENSTEGAVGRTLDLLLQTSLTVCGEIQLPVHQSLLSIQTDLTKIDKIYSHPQSFAQCHHWLQTTLPGISSAAYINASSNADAARLAAQDEHAAAIAGKRAADFYGLKICAENIEDDSKNTTRFLVLGTQKVAPSGKDKTSLIMSTGNYAGAIHKLLTPLADHNVSMTRLESRPSRTHLWQYVFFVDIEGHQKDTNVATALKELNEKAAFLKILGSYPAT
ncbi:prephenate dehydratase [Nitrosomonas sp.]|uniref:prephenate dehydratase n=1 Tax=Nitrosomonas sp. TaxID=42353 RepID=UPI001D1E1148|nr:prephenate dehydratase [Nitrosomonas sp.]MCB1949058.1 prephenate dehydratase [Nitrosomonas sp.]MCP5242119.1 prephenate dehydratase [Burkholderiales bacterium]MDR4514680.1 prephenate dehydratase [Nitrosomonas sp.]